jgi:hypothetical protein
MATVEDLLPGDEVTQGSTSGVFITRSYHPIHGVSLALVIWRTQGRWSLDALDWRQDVGTITPATAQDRWRRIQEAFREDTR